MTLPSLCILRADDGAALAALSQAADPHRSWTAQSWRDCLEQDSTLVIGLADDPGGLLGAIALSLTPDFADILNLLVLPAARRKGYAGRLIGAALRHAGERGIARLCLDVSAENMPARQLYARFGFTEDGRRPRYYQDGADAILMTRFVVDPTGLGGGVGPFTKHEPD